MWILPKSTTILTNILKAVIFNIIHWARSFIWATFYRQDDKWGEHGNKGLYISYIPILHFILAAAISPLFSHNFPHFCLLFSVSAPSYCCETVTMWFSYSIPHTMFATTARPGDKWGYFYTTNISSQHSNISQHKKETRKSGNNLD